MKPVRLVVLLSGGGRTLENFLARIDQGKLDVEIVAVVSSRRKVRGVRLARERGIPVEVFPRNKFSSIAEHNAAINAWLAPHRPEIIALAGYLCFYIPPADFQGPVVNIHPALLPKFGGQGFFGDRVHQAVLEAGETQSGCTAHHVNDEYDAGGIIARVTVPVHQDDDAHTLAARVFTAECDLYPRVLQEMACEIRQTRE